VLWIEAVRWVPSPRRSSAPTPGWRATWISGELGARSVSRSRAMTSMVRSAPHCAVPTAWPPVSTRSWDACAPSGQCSR